MHASIHCLIDPTNQVGKGFTTTDVDLIFTKAHAKGARKMKYDEFQKALQMIADKKGVSVEEIVIPDDIHDFLLFRSWSTVVTATGEYFERMFFKHAPSSP